MKSSHPMRCRLLLGACSLLFFAGCVQRAPLLYQWDAFPKMQYASLLRPGVPSTEQIAPMEAQAERARGKGAALPPGFRAHLGMLKLAVGDPDRARQLWLAEKEAFPESAPYMDQLLKRLDSPVNNDSLKDPPA